MTPERWQQVARVYQSALEQVPASRAAAVYCADELAVDDREVTDFDRERSIRVEFKLQRVLRVTSFSEQERTRPALAYWRSRPPAERIAAVEFLRRQFHGSGARLRRVHRVLDCPWR